MKAKLLTNAAAVILTSLVGYSKAQTASIQVIHNCADAAASTVDIYAGTNLLIDNLNFRSASQTFTNIPAATVLTIGVAPGTSTSSTQSLATFTVSFAANSTNIIVADGILSPSGYSPSSSVAPFTLNVYTAGVTAAPNATTTSLLVHHGSTDAPVVDIVAPFTGTNPVVPNVLVNNAAYPVFSSYLNLPTANYKIQVRDQNSENVVAEYQAPLSSLNLGGAALTVIASGFLNPANNSNGPAFGLYVASAAGGTLLPLPTSTISSTRLQAIHNCADLAAAQVDVWFKSATTGTAAVLLIDNFAFRTASPYIDVPTGETLTLSIAAPTSTSSANAIANFTYNLAAANKYQLVASGIVSPSGYTPSSMIAPFDLRVNANARERSLNAANTDVLVFHGATDAPSVGVSATGAGTLLSAFGFGSFANEGYLPLPSNTAAGNYTVHVTNAAGTATVASYLAPLNTLNLSGSAITVLASGFLDPAQNSTGPAFGLWVALPSGGNLVALPPYTDITTGFLTPVNAASSLLVFPNPFADNIRVNNPNNENFSYELRSIEGRLVAAGVGAAESTSIDTSSLPSGLYLLTTTVGSTVTTSKVAKQ